MITTKIVRAVVVLAVVALLVIVGVEVYWSMTAKDDARKAAERAADNAFAIMSSGGDSLAARQAAEATATAEHTHLVAFVVDPTGVVRVTVNTRAKSYVLRHFGPTRSVSEVTVTESSTPPD